MELVRHRLLQNGDQATVLIERVGSIVAAARAAVEPSGPDEGPASPDEPRGDVVSAGRFRSGLTEEDLHLTPAEARDFEP